MLAYLDDYARRYELEPSIEFGTTVKEARPVFEGGEERWDLTLASGERRRYKGIIACVGHHWDRRWPSYPGPSPVRSSTRRTTSRPSSCAASAC